MSNEYDEIIEELKEKITQIILLYTDSNKRLENLQSENNKLKEELNEKKNQFKELEEGYKNLKSAKVISANSKDLQQTKHKINKIVREVDNCISLLNK